MRTGTRPWSATPAVSADGRFVYGLDDLRKIDAATGKAVWSSGMRRSGGCAVYYSHVLVTQDGKHMLFGSSSGNLVKVDTASGKEAWAFPAGVGCSSTFFALSKDREEKHVYVASGGGTWLYKVDSATGTKIWATDIGARAASLPVLDSDGTHVYLSASSPGLVKVDTATGRKVWAFDATGSVVAESWMITPSLSLDGRSIYVYV